MPRAQWVLMLERPVVQIVLTSSQSGQKALRTLVADTGAGGANDPFEFVLDEVDCLHWGGTPFKKITLSGSYSGSFPLYLVGVEIPALRFRDKVFAVAVKATPDGFDGIACFRFLNRFTYGNFGNQSEFVIET
jgi:hypothetical protein